MRTSDNLELGRKPAKLLIRPKHINPKPLADYDHAKCKESLYRNYNSGQ